MNTYKYSAADLSAVNVTGSFNGQIPRGHRFWRLHGVDVAEAARTIEAFRTPADVTADAEVTERAWRDEELAKADLELYIIQDGGGNRSVGELRAWRNLLRDYPEHADFPTGQRPPYSA